VVQNLPIHGKGDSIFHAGIKGSFSKKTVPGPVDIGATGPLWVEDWWITEDQGVGCLWPNHHTPGAKIRRGNGKSLYAGSGIFRFICLTTSGWNVRSLGSQF